MNSHRQPVLLSILSIFIKPIFSKIFSNIIQYLLKFQWSLTFLTSILMDIGFDPSQIKQLFFWGGGGIIRYLAPCDLHLWYTQLIFAENSNWNIIIFYNHNIMIYNILFILLFIVTYFKISNMRQVKLTFTKNI